MAMLAEPRRKQKVINLRAKNNAWSNDSTKFGQRMLEKMGWSAGKGLGAKENGIVEHVVARYKNDDRGLGFEDRNDQWTKHEDEFNSLLANLSNSDNNDDKLHSGVSLEDKSKKSKARVHYHKFTRGKDLTRYSEKDLANIFGKKTLKNIKKENLEEVVEKTDTSPTEKVFTDKGSMEDYFKSKLAAFKSKNKSYTVNNDRNKEDSVDYGFKGFSDPSNNEIEEENHQGFGFQSFSFNSTGFGENIEKENIVTVTECLNDTVEPKKKSKKKKKHKCQEEPALTQETELVNDKFDSYSTECEPLKPKKPKKKKQKEEIEPLVEPVEIKKPKKKQREISTTQDHDAEDHVPKKKKKRKNRDIEE